VTRAHLRLKSFRPEENADRGCPWQTFAHSHIRTFAHLHVCSCARVLVCSCAREGGRTEEFTFLLSRTKTSISRRSIPPTRSFESVVAVRSRRSSAPRIPSTFSTRTHTHTQPQERESECGREGERRPARSCLSSFGRDASHGQTDFFLALKFCRLEGTGPGPRRLGLTLRAGDIPRNGRCQVHR
jgi:hypothetical protein